MATKQFDSLLNEYLSLLTEAPVSLEVDPKEAAKFLGKNATKYVVDTLSKKLNIPTEQVWNDLEEFGFFEQLFPGNVNPSNDEGTFRRSMANVITKLIPQFKEKYNVSEISGVGSAPVGYTSRIASTAGEKGQLFKKEYDNRARKERPEAIKAAPITKETTAQERFGKDLDKDMQRIWDRVNASSGVSENELNEIARTTSASPEDGEFNKRILIKQGYLAKEGDKIVAKDPKEITSDDSEIPALEAPYEGEIDLDEIAGALQDWEKERDYSRDY